MVTSQSLLTNQDHPPQVPSTTQSITSRQEIWNHNNITFSLSGSCHRILVPWLLQTELLKTTSSLDQLKLNSMNSEVPLEMNTRRLYGQLASTRAVYAAVIYNRCLIGAYCRISSATTSCRTSKQSRTLSVVELLPLLRARSLAIKDIGVMVILRDLCCGCTER
jgi:hypothetical protein